MWVGESWSSDRGTVTCDEKDGIACNCKPFVYRKEGMWCRHISEAIGTMGNIKIGAKTIREHALNLLPEDKKKEANSDFV